MALKPEKAYLHLLTGGYDNAKRRQVRSLFATPAAKQDGGDDEVTTENLDIAVGLLEEFYSIGVKEFNLEQASKTLKIFGLSFLADSQLQEVLENPRLRLHSHNGVWAVPDEKHIEGLRTSFCDCDEENLKARNDFLTRRSNPEVAA